MTNPFSDLEMNADHIDSKAFDGNKTLREYVAGMMNYCPGWITILYKIRGGLARLFGLRHADIEYSTNLRPEELDFTPGKNVSFFTTVLAKEDEYWAGEATDKHLSGFVCVRAQPLQDGRTRFHTQTIVHYKHWTGPLYFNLIRPFHHLIVNAMGKAAVRD